MILCIWRLGINGYRLEGIGINGYRLEGGWEVGEKCNITIPGQKFNNKTNFFSQQN